MLSGKTKKNVLLYHMSYITVLARVQVSNAVKAHLTAVFKVSSLGMSGVVVSVALHP